MGLDPTWLLTQLSDYKYAAMMAILLLCGVGLPLPEEVTLITSGLLVGWQQADFVATALACCFGILAGDCVIFAAGRHFGQRFFRSRPVSYLLSPSRSGRVKNLFDRYGSFALFVARFLPGIRIGVYAYAGAERVGWLRFLALDGLGVAISAPASIWAGRLAGRAFADDPQQAVAQAMHTMRSMGHWLFVAIVALVVLLWVGRVLLRRISTRN